MNRWDFPTGTLGESIPLKPAILPGQPLLMPIVRVTADGTRACGFKSPSEVFDLATGQHLFVVPPPSAPPAPHRVHFSHDGLRVATLCLPGPRQRTGTCVVWDIVTPRRIAEIEVPATRSFPLIDFSPSGNRLVLGCVISKPLEQRQMLRVIGWDLKEGKKLGEVEDADAIGEFMMSAVSETTAIFSGMNGKLWSVDFEAGKLGSEYDPLPVRNERAVRSTVVVSPDGKRFATGLVGDELEIYGVRVYDFPSGKRTHTFQGHLGPITSLRFTPDSNAIATGSEDSSVILWDLTKPVEK